MFEQVIWVVSFLSLFLGIFWINVLYLDIPERKKQNYKPGISIIIPAYNEEKTLPRTIRSISRVNYPKEKLHIIIVNDDSKDKTKQVALSLIKQYENLNIKLINRKKKPGQFTKAPALNEALQYIKTELFACIDADTIISPSSIKNLLPLFKEKETAAVISAIKIYNPKTIWEKIQRLEYILSTFIRKLMSKIETLHIAPGALSVYKTEVIKKLGGFDEDNLTEDLEIAMRLRFNNYKLKISTDSITYTNPPRTFKQLWDQRIRWFRGFIHNTKKYKKMFMNKNYGMMGLFQYPLNILTLFTVILMFILVSYELLRNILRFMTRLSVLNLSAINFNFPSIKEIILGVNIKIMFPISVSLVLALFIYYKAHQTIGERLKNPLALVTYLTVYPLIRGLHWVTALTKEVVKEKKKW